MYEYIAHLTTVHLVAGVVFRAVMVNMKVCVYTMRAHILQDISGMITRGSSCAVTAVYHYV
jgi:hypothetical protein